MDISKHTALLQGQFTFNFQTVKLYLYSGYIRFKNKHIESALPFCFDLSYDVQVRSKQWVLSFYMDPPFEHYQLVESSQHIKFQFISDQDINIWDAKLIQFIKRKGFNRRFTQEVMLGEGAYGRVYQIWNFFTSKTSAAKVISIEQIYKSLKRKKGIDNEIQILRKIKKINGNRQNLLQIQGVYEGQDKIYVATQLINGRNLREIMVQKSNFLKIQTRKKIMRGILTGIAALCQNNIVHRDIKPENIMISEGETIKIVDFGFANELNSQLIFTMCGTQGYLAPELCVQHVDQIKITSKMDVFGAGTILYEMIFKTPLVEGQGYIYCHNQKNLDIEIQRFKVQKTQAELLSKMLVNEPQKRISAEQALKLDYFSKKGLQTNLKQNNRNMFRGEKDKQASMGVPIKKVKRQKQN